MNVDQKEIMKTAASQLRSLVSEVETFREVKQKQEVVEEILQKTAENLSGFETLEQRDDLMEKDLEELKIIDKAVELQKTGELKLGSLSIESADNGELDPLTALLLEDLQ